MTRDFFGNAKSAIENAAADEIAKENARRDREDVALSNFKTRHAQLIGTVEAAFSAFIANAEGNGAMAEMKVRSQVSGDIVHLFYIELRFALKKGSWTDSTISHYYVRAGITGAGQVSCSGLAALAGPTSGALLPFGEAKEIPHDGSLSDRIADYIEEILRRAMQYKSK